MSDLNRIVDQAVLTITHGAHELAMTADRFYWSEPGSYRRHMHLDDIMREGERVMDAFNAMKRAIHGAAIDQLGWGGAPAAFTPPHIEDDDEIPF